MHYPSGREQLRNALMVYISGDAIPERIPKKLDEYLLDAQYPEEGPDDDFYQSIAKTLWDDVISIVKTKIDPLSEQWTHLPYILCGGGRSLDLYKKFFELVNHNNSTKVRLIPILWPKPDNLVGDGIGENVFQRLTVAYGLSFEEIGEILTSDSIKDLYITRREKDISGRYISKEQM